MIKDAVYWRGWATRLFLCMHLHGWPVSNIPLQAINCTDIDSIDIPAKSCRLSSRKGQEIRNQLMTSLSPKMSVVSSLVPTNSKQVVKGLLTNGHVTRHARIDDWMIPSAACHYWRLNDPFCWEHCSRDCHCFWMGRTTPKNCPLKWGSGPNLIHGSLDQR